MELSRAQHTLSLPPNSSLSAARMAYREKLRKYHPDTGTGDAASLAAVRTAYHTIVAAEIAATTAPPVEQRPRIDVYA